LPIAGSIGARSGRVVSFFKRHPVRIARPL
jgi:hypothetical protein